MLAALPIILVSLVFLIWYNGKKTPIVAVFSYPEQKDSFSINQSFILLESEYGHATGKSNASGYR